MHACRHACVLSMRYPISRRPARPSSHTCPSPDIAACLAVCLSAGLEGGVEAPAVPEVGLPAVTGDVSAVLPSASVNVSGEFGNNRVLSGVQGAGVFCGFTSADRSIG